MIIYYNSTFSLENDYVIYMKIYFDDVNWYNKSM